ncbi:hypothetical protein [Candidatus Ichthyocystis sparus]|uniref:hypothetical protein n=1 Tax=Candidatus Ichthyocystis sparus TaxID=1561004 RepID=UPI0011465D4E|nr:hypothetical protein [Candidatus Ichthyocystis sparus]
MNINNRNYATSSSSGSAEGNDALNESGDGSTGGSQQGPLSQQASNTRGGVGNSGGLGAHRLSLISVLSCLMALFQEVSSSSSTVTTPTNSSSSNNTISFSEVRRWGMVKICVVASAALLTVAVLALSIFCSSRGRVSGGEHRPAVAGTDGNGSGDAEGSPETGRDERASGSGEGGDGQPMEMAELGGGSAPGEENGAELQSTSL